MEVINDWRCCDGRWLKG